MGDANISERYHSGDAYLRISGPWRELPMREEGGYHHTVRKSVVSSVEFDGSPNPMSDSEVVQPGKAPHCCCGYEFHVLVDVPHLKDGAKGIIPSVVRAKADNGFYEITIKALKVGARRRLKSLKVLPGREVDPLRVGLGDRKSRHGDSDLVEAGPQLVDEFSRDNVENLRRWLTKDRLHNLVSGLGVYVDYDLGVIGLKKLVFDGFEVDEVSVGSVDFEFWSKER